MRKRREQRISIAAAIFGVLFGAAVMVVLVFGYMPWNGAEASTPIEPTPQETDSMEYEAFGANIFDL